MGSAGLREPLHSLLASRLRATPHSGLPGVKELGGERQLLGGPLFSGRQRRGTGMPAHGLSQRSNTAPLGGGAAAGWGMWRGIHTATKIGQTAGPMPIA